MRNITIVFSALVGASILCSPIVANAKTAKECSAEWKANKKANETNKIKEKDYVKQCEAGGAAAQPAAPSATPKPTKKETKMAPAPAAPAAKTTVAPPPAKSSSVATGANQYTTETQAKARCGSGIVVWANLKSKIYHFSGNKDYGNTKEGAYMCERDATGEGMRAAKNEKHP